MPSTFTSGKGRLEKQAIGSNDGTWGNVLNDILDRIDALTSGYLEKDVAGGTDVTLTAEESRNAYIKFGGQLTGNISVEVAEYPGWYIFENATTGDYTLTVKPAGGSGFVVPQGTKVFAFTDGSTIFPATRHIEGVLASTGSPNAYVLTPSPALDAYRTGDRISFRANFANTGAATLNVSSLGAKSIKKMTASGKADLLSGDIQSGQPVTVEYDGTDMVMVTPPSTLHINGLPEDTSPDFGADYVATYDASAGTNKKVLLGRIAAGPMFQCRLTLDTDSGNLVLSRCNGKYLFIGGVNYEIPAEGVSLPPTGLSVYTTYNIYAYMDAGTMKLEASTTPPAVYADTGVKVKAGAGGQNYTLVGMASVLPGPTWVDTDAQRFVLSYFNRRAKPVVGANTGGATTASTSIVELTTAARAEFLTWGDEAVSIGLAGYAFNSNAGVNVFASIGLDGSSVGTGDIAQAPNPNGPASHNARHTAYLSEGYHYVTPMGSVGSNTGTFFYRIYATIQG